MLYLHWVHDWVCINAHMHKQTIVYCVACSLSLAVSLAVSVSVSRCAYVASGNIDYTSTTSATGPFGTLPQYGLEYWPKNAKLIQVDLNARNLGLTRPADVCIQGDAALAALEILKRLQAKGDHAIASAASRTERQNKIAQYQQQWAKELDAMTFGGPSNTESLCKPRAALRALENALPNNAIVSTDIGNVCSVSNSYLRFEHERSMLAAMTFGNCGYSFPAAMGAKVARPDRPVFAYVGDGAWGMSLNEVLTCVREDIPVTAVVFNNQQWGAEKKNQVLWFGDRYVGSNLINPSFAEVSRAMGAEGIRCTKVEQIADAVAACTENQRNGKATVLEIMCTRELGDPFRRDAMRLPQRLLPKYQHTSLTTESKTGQPTDIQVAV
jgi:sulfoacetaldehyde acetyltransferase